MFNGMGGVSLADIAAVSGNRNNDGFGDGGWWAWIILFALFGGWGGNGWGNNGNNAVNNDALEAALQRGFDNQAVVNKLDGITNGICSLGYDQLNQMNGIDKSVMQLGFNLQQAINAIGAQGQQCCCDVRGDIKDMQYNMATEACATRQEIHNTGDAIQHALSWGLRDISDQMRNGFEAVQHQADQRYIAELEHKVNSSERDSDLSRWANYIINTVDPRSQPAYITCNPNTGMVFPNMGQNPIPVSINQGCCCNN